MAVSLLVGVAIAAPVTRPRAVNAAGSDGSADRPARHGPSLLAVESLGHRRGITEMTTSGRVLPKRAVDVNSPFAISPDGRQIANETGLLSISIRPLSGGAPTAVVRRADDPAWSPDGQQLAVDSYGPGAPHDVKNIFTVDPGHAKRLFFRDSTWDTDPTWSPDGTEIAFERGSPVGGYGGPRTGIYISNGTTLRRLIADRHGLAFDPAWSPDGRRIAFDDTRNGAHIGYDHTTDIYVINVDGTHLRQITHDPRRDDQSPHWSPDGRELAFTVSTPDLARAAVAVKAFGTPRARCLVRPTWGEAWPIAWDPGRQPTPPPRHCSPTLRPPRPKPRFGCTKAAARSAVGRSQLPLSLKAYAHYRPWSISKRCVDFTHDGRTDLAVLFNGGGSGGTIAWAAFRRTRHDWKQVLVKNGGRLTVATSGSDLLESYPIYRPGDCHCDPTGGVAHREYGWNGHRLVVVARWHTNH